MGISGGLIRIRAEEKKIFIGTWNIQTAIIQMSDPTEKSITGMIIFLRSTL